METKNIAWNTGTGNITLTYNGQGDGPISVQTDANNGSARSQVITVETVGGAITRNFTVNQAGCPFPVGDVKNFSYTGSYQEVELPAGQYKLQCWGAQGGSNAAASSYSITAKAGGKGGYSEGIITLSQKTTVRVYVGGAGSSSAGGFNGGGSTTGSSTYNASNEQGVSRMGGGGGATDIRLSDGALLSRMIVAGGGAGGAMCYKRVTTSGTRTVNDGSSSSVIATSGSGYKLLMTLSASAGVTYNCSYSGMVRVKTYINGWLDAGGYIGENISTLSPSSATKYAFFLDPKDSTTVSVSVSHTESYSYDTTYNDSQVGGVGGGTSGGGYSTTYVGKQNAAGSGGSFGQGAAQSVTNYRYCSGAGGGGWYGGGTTYRDSAMTSCKYGGGGSGFVNTAASAGNRPSGYTGLQLDSGKTKDGNTSFPNTAGNGNETGHAGNGYAKITRLA